MDSQQLQRRSLMILLIGVGLLVALVFSPLFKSLIIAVILAIASWPLHLRLTRLLRNKAGISAGIIVTGTTLLIVGPAVALVTFLISQVAGAKEFVITALQSEKIAHFYAHLPGWLHRFLDEYVNQPGASSWTDQLGSIGTKAAQALGAAASATSVALFTLGMALIAFFVMLIQKETIIQWIARVSPLRQRQTHELLEEFRSVTSAVFRSTFASALMQGLAAFIGFLIAGVPHSLLFAVIAFGGGIIPAGISALLSFLLAVFLGLTGHPGSAIFLGLWSIFVVGMVDNVVKPLVLKGRSGTTLNNGGIVFFSLIGGLMAFGPVGLLLGPLAIALFAACLKIYRRDYGGGAPVTPSSPSEPREPDASRS